MIIIEKPSNSLDQAGNLLNKIANLTIKGFTSTSHVRVPHKTSDFGKTRSPGKYGSMDLSNYKSPNKTNIFSEESPKAINFNEDIHSKGPNGSKDGSYSGYRRPINASRFKEVCSTIIHKQSANLGLQAHEDEMMRISSNYDLSRKKKNLTRTWMGNKTTRELGTMA